MVVDNGFLSVSEAEEGGGLAMDDWALSPDQSDASADSSELPHEISGSRCKKEDVFFDGPGADVDDDDDDESVAPFFTGSIDIRRPPGTRASSRSVHFSGANWPLLLLIVHAIGPAARTFSALISLPSGLFLSGIFLFFSFF